MPKIPKPLTRKRAAILGAGAGGSLIAYREVPKLFKVPGPMYGQEQGYVGKADMEPHWLDEYNRPVFEGQDEFARGLNEAMQRKMRADRLKLGLLGGSIVAGTGLGLAIRHKRQQGKKRVAKGLSRNQIAGLEAMAAQERRQTPGQPPVGGERRAPVPPKSLIANKAELARLRLERHTIGRERAAAIAERRQGRNTKYNFTDASNRLAWNKSGTQRLQIPLGLQLAAENIPDTPAAKDLPWLQRHEYEGDFPLKANKRADMRAEGIRNTYLREKKVGRRGIKGNKHTIAAHQAEIERYRAMGQLPPTRAERERTSHLSDIRRQMQEQLERNKGVAEAEGWVKPPAPQTAVDVGSSTPHAPVATRRMPRGRLALVGAGIGGVGLTAEGVRRSVQRNKDRSRHMVRKDDWAEQQRYLEDQQRAEAKRASGRRKVGWGLNTLGLTGLLGVGGIRSKDPKHIKIGGMWAREEPKYHPLVSTKKFKISASKGPLAMAGVGAGLIGYGAHEKHAAGGVDRDLKRRLNNELAAEHEQNLKNYVSVPR